MYNSAFSCAELKSKGYYLKVPVYNTLVPHLQPLGGDCTAGAGNVASVTIPIGNAFGAIFHPEDLLASA